MSRCLRRSIVLLVPMIGAVLAGCGGDDGDDSRGGDDVAGGRPSGAVTVLAAVSLTESFTELGAAFEDEFVGTSVTFNFAASSALATQILEGAPADVYASADEVSMARLAEGAGTSEDPQVFASNELQIIVEAGNPLGISVLRDLADPDVLFVTAAPEVPLGRYAEQVLDVAGVDATPRSFEQSSRGVVTKVALGEADVGIGFASDVLAAADDVDGIDIPADVDVVARYPIAVPAGATNVDTAEAFVDFVLSAAGREILESYGFGAP